MASSPLPCGHPGCSLDGITNPESDELTVLQPSDFLSYPRLLLSSTKTFNNPEI